VNPDGMEVIVPVTAAMLPLELGLPVAVELGVPVSLSVGELLSLSVGDLVLVPIGPPPVELVPGRDCGDVDAPLGMMTPTLVEVQFAGPPLGPHTIVVLVAVVFG